MNKQRLIILIASALGMLATFLPWVTVPFMGSITGTSLPQRWEYNGWISLVFFGVILAVSLSGNQKIKLDKTSLIVISIFSIFAFLNVFALYSDFKTAMDGIRASIESGIYLSIIAALILIVFTIKDLKFKVSIKRINKQRLVILFVSGIGMLSTFLPMMLWLSIGIKSDSILGLARYPILLLAVPFVLSLAKDVTKPLNTKSLLGIIMASLLAVLLGLNVQVPFERLITLDNELIYRITSADWYLIILAGFILFGFALIILVKEKNFNNKIDNQRLSILMIAAFGIIVTYLPSILCSFIGLAQNPIGGHMAYPIFVIPIVISLLNDITKPLNKWLLYIIILMSVFAGLYGLVTIVHIKKVVEFDGIDNSVLMFQYADCYLVILTAFILFVYIIKGFIIDYRIKKNHKRNLVILAVFLSVIGIIVALSTWAIDKFKGDDVNHKLELKINSKKNIKLKEENVTQKIELILNPTQAITDLDIIKLFDVSIKSLGNDFINSEDLNNKPEYIISSKQFYKIGQREFLLASLGISNPNSFRNSFGRSDLALFEFKNNIWVKIDHSINISNESFGGYGEFKGFMPYGKNNFCGVYRFQAGGGTGFQSYLTSVYGVFKDKLKLLIQVEDIDNYTGTAIGDIKDGTSTKTNIDFENSENDFYTLKLTEYRNKKLHNVKKYNFLESTGEYKLSN